MDGLLTLTTAVLLTILIMFLFFHVNYKKYKLFSTVNEIFMFKKMLFNKKYSNCVGKKIIISHLIFVSVSFIYTVIVAVYKSVFTYGEAEIISMHLDSSVTYTYMDCIKEILVALLIFIICGFIIRLIYEFIVVSIAVTNSQTQIYQQNVYRQSEPPQQLNTPYTQQNHTMPSNQVTNSNRPDDADITATGQGLTASEAQFKFCSQCGTRYNDTDDKCPNCGMN